MQKTIRVKTSLGATFRLKVATAAVLSALLVSQASAAGLGRLTVLSSLGQPLRAEIELTMVAPNELRTLQPKLASIEAFKQSNIEFNPSLYALRFAVEQRAGRDLIRITSTQAMTEPFVDVLLELNGINGRLVREYTMLLDPPELRPLQNVQEAQVGTLPMPSSVLPIPSSNGQTATRTASGGSGPARQFESPKASGVIPNAREPQAIPVRAVAGKTAGKAAGAGYKVQRGDSLSRIADRTKPANISLDQMLVALFRANPEAFIDNNMNRLRAGQILSVPSTEVSGAIAEQEAQGLVIAQAADFNDYRNKLAGRVATGNAQKSAESKQSASGKIAAKVEERSTQANEALDKLKLSKADASAASKTAAAQEEKIAREKASAEAASRVKELEKNLNDLQKLLEVKSKNLAEQQKNLEAAKATPKPTPVETAAVVTPAIVETKPQSAPVVATLEPKPLPKVVTVTPPTIIEPVVPAPPVKAATPSLVTKPNVTPPPAKVESGVMDDLLENPTALGGGALLAILVGAFAVFRTRSRKKKIAFENTGIADTSLKANSLFGTTGGQSVDTSNSVFNSSFAPAASTLDSNEVDPVAEADVYIAYGRDVQAEEILKEALRTHPDRHAIRVKLLEIYNNRKDARAFESVATELYSMSKGEGDEWAQAAAMGIVLDPTNELYASGVGAATIANPLSASFASESKLMPQPPLKDASELEALLAEIAVNESSEPFERMPVESASASNSVDNSRTIDPIDNADLASRLNSPSNTSPPVNSTSSIDNSLDFASGIITAKTEADKADTSKIEKNIAETTKAESNSTNKETIKAKAGELAAQQADAATAAAIKMAEIDLNFLDPIPTAPAETALTTPTPNKGEIQTDPKTGMKNSSEPVAFTADQSLIKSQPDVITSKAPVPSKVDVSSLGDFAIDPIPTDAAQSTLDNRALEFDLSGITLDLPDNLPGNTGAAALPSAQGTHTAEESTLGQDQLKSLDLDTELTSDDAAALDSMSNHAEMATKLDLAVAYQEIGDHEGARELLDEVCKNGNDEQSEKAKSMLEHMA